MALPLLPIILAVTALGSGIVQSISSAKNARNEAKAMQQQAQDQINERARQAKKLMSQQKTSFLKSGVYFDSGSPLAVINETYDTMNQDINAITNDSNTKINNLMRQGKTAFFGSLIESAANAGMAYFLNGGNISNTGQSNLTSTFQNLYSSLGSGVKGGFGQLPTNNGYSNSNVNKIV